MILLCVVIEDSEPTSKDFHDLTRLSLTSNLKGNLSLKSITWPRFEL